METYSETIGRFAGGLRLADVPPAVVEKAKLVFLDTLGIALASSTMDFGLMAINVARKLSGPKASLLIGTSDRVAAANAVMANGTLAHGLDYDDTLEEAIVHTGCCAGMTALAVGEEVGATARRCSKQRLWARKFSAKWVSWRRANSMRADFTRPQSVRLSAPLQPRASSMV